MDKGIIGGALVIILGFLAKLFMSNREAGKYKKEAQEARDEIRDGEVARAGDDYVRKESEADADLHSVRSGSFSARKSRLLANARERMRRKRG